MVLCNLVIPPDGRVTCHNTSILFPKIDWVSGDFIGIYKMSLDVTVRDVLNCDSDCGTTTLRQFIPQRMRHTSHGIPHVGIQVLLR